MINSLELRWTVAGLVCSLMGCGTPPTVTVPGSSGTSSGTGGSAEVFSDDTDPATAALPFAERELLIQPYPGADANALSDVYERAEVHVIGELEEIQLTIVEVAEGSLETSAQRLAQSGLIEAIHKNYILTAQELPDDPDLGMQTHIVQIGAPQAWDQTTGSDAALIAIVDTGVQPDHPDLLDRIARGWNVYDNSDDSSDPVGHGTHVAGVVAAATNNRAGVAGITWSNPILAVRAADVTGQTTGRHVAAGILWAVGQGAKVINVSFAPLWSNSVVRSAARQAYHRGALVVISAGNGGGTTSARGYDEALFVGAIDDASAVAPFSDRGPFVDLTAPGTGIYSTALGSSYRAADGTSFAAPIVAGVVALAWSMNPDLRPVSIVEVVTGTATDLGARGRDDAYGHGAVDALAAVELAAQTSFIPDDSPPSLSIKEPDDGEVVSDRLVASVKATDRWGVADVVMRVDDLPLATDSREPYRFVVDARNFNPGRHELSFIATDLAGNVSDVQAISVMFSETRTSGGGEAGSVTFLAPDSGTEVSGDVHISATVAANAGLAAIEWRIDGVSVLTTVLSDASSRVSYIWRASDAPRGRHRVTIVVTNSEGGQATGSLNLVVR